MKCRSHESVQLLIFCLLMWFTAILKAPRNGSELQWYSRIPHPSGEREDERLTMIVEQSGTESESRGSEERKVCFLAALANAAAVIGFNILLRICSYSMHLHSTRNSDRHLTCSQSLSLHSSPKLTEPRRRASRQSEDLQSREPSKTE